MNRIFKIRYWLPIFAAIFAFALCSRVAAQSKVLNKYGLFVISGPKTLQKEIENDPGKQMINLTEFIPGLILDLKYATAHNFMHQKLYPYYLPKSSSFELLDLSFAGLKKCIKKVKKKTKLLDLLLAFQPSA